jgi:hypothetical protein
MENEMKDFIQRILPIPLVLAMSISAFGQSFFTEASLTLPSASSQSSCTHYIAINGSDTNPGTLLSQPWATFAHAMRYLEPGDTLCIADGSYFQSLDITISGTEANPITFIAINDGKVTIDGEFNRVACRVMDSHDVVVEGIVCQRSSQSVFTVVRSERVTVRRVSAYDVKATDCNCHAFTTDRAQDVLFEDVIAGGRARTTFTLYNSQRITVRRAYARWKEEPTSNSMGVNNLAQYYGTSDSLSENNVGTLDGPTPNSVTGWGVWNHYYNTDPIASNNSFLGNISFDLTHAGFFDSSCKWQTSNNQFIDNVSINNRFGMWQRGDDSQILSHYTSVGGEIGYYMHENPPTGDCEPATGLVLGSDIMDSTFLNASSRAFIIHDTDIPKDLSHDYNLFWDNAGLGTTLNANETVQVDPLFNVEKWGYGGYLFPDPDSPRAAGGQDGSYLGGDVRYRYVDGALTDIPLWPWPMEERVCDELGVSVTWERSDQVSAKTGQSCQGGLWKTLDGVYSVSEQTFSDVSPDHWAYDDIETLYHDGFIAGCSSQPLMYCPEQAMTRAESAVFVERGVHGGGYFPEHPDQAVFEDVPLNEWFAKWSHQLWEDGYTAGCSSAPLRFCPLAVHTRAEATVFFIRMMKGKDYLPSEPSQQIYEDVPLGIWYSKWITAAYEEGLLQNCEDPENRSDNLFRPEHELTRAEAACMMVLAKETQIVGKATQP